MKSIRRRLREHFATETTPDSAPISQEERLKDEERNTAARVPDSQDIKVRELLLTEVYSRETFDNLMNGLRDLGVDSLEFSEPNESKSPLDAVAEVRDSPLWKSIEVCSVVRSDRDYDPAIRIFPVVLYDLPPEFFSVRLAVESSTPSATVLVARFIFSDAAASRLRGAIDKPYWSTTGPEDRRGFRPRWNSEHLRFKAVENVYRSLRNEGEAWLAGAFRGLLSDAELGDSRPACWVISVDTDDSWTPPSGLNFVDYAQVSSGNRAFKVQGGEAFLQLDDRQRGRHGATLFGSSEQLSSLSYYNQPVAVVDADPGDLSTSAGWALQAGNVVHVTERFFVWDTVRAALEARYVELVRYRNAFGPISAGFSDPKLLRRGATDAARILLDVSALESEALQLLEKGLFSTTLPTLEPRTTDDGTTGVSVEEQHRSSIRAYASSCRSLREAIRDAVPVVSAFHVSAASIASSRFSKIVAALALAVSASSLGVASCTAFDNPDEPPPPAVVEQAPDRAPPPPPTRTR